MDDHYSLGGKVFTQLKNSILAGEFEDGAELREISLSKKLGVSRTPVREALRQLEQEGLVYPVKGKGNFIADSEDVKKAKELHPDALVLAHPECTGDTLALADFVGSTSQIIDYATASDSKKFLICTEMGVFYELMQKNPDKKFFSVGHRQFCPNMKKVSLDKVLEKLENLKDEVILPEEMCEQAKKPLDEMLRLAQ